MEDSLMISIKDFQEEIDSDKDNITKNNFLRDLFL